ncbi:serine/threonine protein kinase [Helicocarpus griseus UAMH5409]|uniref:Serine/threonine protein kinase n=1 Tax=Helicocarpus griseus UAMH5409 TaxID=1447875 RepID=A0A2B7XZG2_9EURO|nr:serine/threonine protein kinase [Helicocarpus griseus UAMH5409]
MARWHQQQHPSTRSAMTRQILATRYLIEHKLDAGGFSTVWMAHDLQERKDVALKVMISGQEDGEICIQDLILQTVPDTSHLVTYLTTFLLPGTNHRVLVFPLRGPCLDYITIKDMSMATRMSAAKQLLEALENLHRAGIVHRDLNERNCMWGIVVLHNLHRSAKYEALDRPHKQIIPFVKLPKQGELVLRMKIREKLRTEEFYLGDFGLAMRLGDPKTEGRPPMEFCSPDRLHRKNPSLACDMWSYTVIFARLYLGFAPFPAGIEDGVIAGMVRQLGPLPEQWKGQYIWPEDAFDSWNDQGNRPDPASNLAATIAYFHPDADPNERELVHSVLSRGFIYCPEKRLTAAQTLQDPSFRAIMKRYGC